MENGKESKSTIEKLDMKEHGSTTTLETEAEDPSLRTVPQSVRMRLCKIFDSHKFQIGIVALVIFDCLIVIAELILEAKHHEFEDKTLFHVLHSMSIAILSLFVVEVLLKVFAMGGEFFHHKLEVFDAAIIFLSFALDIAFWEQEGVDLIIILRLWRVARILNGVVVTVETHAERKIMKERRLREAAENELEKNRARVNELSQEVARLKELLAEHDITIPSISPVKVSPPKKSPPKISPERNISVVVEVNRVESQ